MRLMSAVATAAVVVVALTGAAKGGNSDAAAGPWADSVVRFVPGPRIDGSAIPTARNDPSAALGPAESPAGNDDPIPSGTFVSLGFGGSLTLGFQNPICNGEGSDFAIDVREITKEPYPPETASVYVSSDGTTWTLAGTISRDAQVAIPKTIPIVWFVALVDTTDHNQFTLRSNADGFDVDGVSALDSTSCSGVPPVIPTGAGDPLASAKPPSPTVRCTTSYWKDPRVLRVWPIKRTKRFNAVFGVQTFPRKSLLTIAFQAGGGNRALAREGVMGLLTSLTGGTGYKYKPAGVKRLVHTGLTSHNPRLVANTVNRLKTARTRGVCPRHA